MWLPIALLCLAQQTLSPLDAFQGNYAAIKAEIDFAYSDGYHETVNGPWDAKDAHFVPTKDSEIMGRWACDGSAEYYRFSSPDAVLARAQSVKPRRAAGKVFFESHFVPKVEALWDGRILLSHHHVRGSQLQDGDALWQYVDARLVARNPGVLGDGRAPFYWGFTYTFPHILDSLFNKIEPVRRASIRGGHPVDVEIYRLEFDGGHGTQFEVSYDPSIGYLPRFARSFDLVPDGPGIVKEMYLVDARPCRAGGFVPTEWFTAEFVVDRLRERFPNYSDDTVLRPKGRVGGGHFLATSFRDRNSPVALTDLRNVHTIVGVGGSVPLRRGTSSITFSDTKSLLGTKLTIPRRLMRANVDVAELHRFDVVPETWGPRAWFAAAVVALIAAAVITRLIRRQRLACVILLCASIALVGCGHTGNPIIKFTGAFQENVLYLDPTATEVPVTLMLRNDGNRAQRIIRIDGGCSCRKVDQERLPADLAPGKVLAAKVRLSVKALSIPQSAQFGLETDAGTFQVVASFVTLVSHQIEPYGGVMTTLNDGQEWAFEWTHRAIRERGHKPDFTVEFPSAFDVKQVSHEAGTVGGVADYEYEDKTYRLALIGETGGLHKEYFRIYGREHRLLLEAPIIWDRVPYLSTVPKSVVIASRRVRVFLRCQDDTIEFTRVRRTPKGVNAVVVSPRELLVSLSNDAPTLVDGEIEVETSAEKRPLLPIHVVRRSGSLVTPPRPPTEALK